MCLCVCNMSLMLLSLGCKEKKKPCSHLSQKRGRRFKVKGCSVNQRLKKDAALTVVTATGKRYLGFMQCFWKTMRLECLREALL